MAYFPAHCDYNCIECSQNKYGWCAFHDCPIGGESVAVTTHPATINPYSYLTTIKEDKDGST